MIWQCLIAGGPTVVIHADVDTLSLRLSARGRPVTRAIWT